MTTVIRVICRFVLVAIFHLIKFTIELMHKYVGDPIGGIRVLFVLAIQMFYTSPHFFGQQKHKLR